MLNNRIIDSVSKSISQPSVNFQPDVVQASRSGLGLEKSREIVEPRLLNRYDCTMGHYHGIVRSHRNLMMTLFHT